ncbi:MAG: YceI family protein [Tahibacter sp.]
MNRHSLARLFLCAFIVSSSAHATPYVFESRHTQGVMRWNHLGFANPGAQISGIVGALDWNAAAPEKSSVKATIPIGGVITGVAELDEDFRSADFFDTAHYPAATFTSTHVEKGGSTGQLKVTGDLVVHGMTQPVTLDVRINKVGVNPRNQLPTVGFEATALLKRSDFGLDRFVPQVSDEIRLAFTVTAVDAADQEKLERKEAAEAAAEKQKAAQTTAK